MAKTDHAQQEQQEHHLAGSDDGMEAEKQKRKAIVHADRHTRGTPSTGCMIVGEPASSIKQRGRPRRWTIKSTKGSSTNRINNWNGNNIKA
jgi:hypothetical protein